MSYNLVVCPLCKKEKAVYSDVFRCCRRQWDTSKCLSENNIKLAEPRETVTYISDNNDEKNGKKD